MSKQVNYNENLCSGAAIRDDKGRRISKLFEASHPKMTVGYARNLIMPSDPEEQEFNFRQSGGGLIEDGVAVIDKVKGNSVVWNQLMKIHSKVDDGEIEQLNFTKGHKYLVFWKQDVDIPSSTRNTLRIDFLYFQRSVENNHPNAGYYNWMFTFEEDSGIHYLAWWVQDCPEGVTPSISNILFYDLTQMFGAGNEPTTYEEFLQRKPKVADEYAYNEGTIVDNKVEKVKTTGVNLWDEEWELGTYRNDNGEKYKDLSRIRSKNPMACTPSTTYYAFYGNGNDQLYVYFYDENMGYITSSPYRVDNRTFISPSNARFFTLGTFGAVTTTYNHDICINLSDPAFNGQYAPYEKHELDLSWVKDIKDAEGVKLFEDGMKSAGTAFDEMRKNKAVKRIAVSTFNGTEDWRINDYAQNKGIMAYQCYSKLKPINDNIRCDRFVTRPWSSSPLAPMSIFAIPKNGIIIETDGTQSLADFKASLEAKPLDVYYELAKPIEVEYDEKNLTYPAVAGGTEEAIASEPSTAFRADIGYGIDAVKTILDLKARVEALEGK